MDAEAPPRRRVASRDVVLYPPMTSCGPSELTSSPSGLCSSLTRCTFLLEDFDGRTQWRSFDAAFNLSIPETLRPRQRITQEKMIIGSSKRRLVVWAAALTILHRYSVTASSWQDPSSNRRPDPPAYRGGVPPRRDEDDDGLYSASVYNNQGDGGGGGGGGFEDRQDDRRPPPPIEQASSSSSSYTPIHYQFPASQERDKRPMGRDLPTDVPLTELDRQSMEERIDDDDREYASARSDVITTFIANKRGRALLTLSSGAVGAALGSFLGKVCKERLYCVCLF